MSDEPRDPNTQDGEQEQQPEQVPDPNIKPPLFDTVTEGFDESFIEKKDGSDKKKK